MGDIMSGLGNFGSGLGSWAMDNPGSAMRIFGQGMNMVSPSTQGIGNMLTLGGDIANIGSAAGGWGSTAGREAANVPSFGVGPDDTLGNAPMTSGALPDYTTARTAIAAAAPTVGKSLDTGMQDIKSIRQEQEARAIQLRDMFGRQGVTPPPLTVVGGRSGGASPTSPVSLPNSAQLIAQILATKPGGFPALGA